MINTYFSTCFVCYNAYYAYLCIMEHTGNSVLIQYATLEDIEAMVARAVDRRIADFYESVREKPPVLVRRKEAARLIGVSLPTIDAYARAGILHAKHVGGRVFFLESELLAVKRR